MKAITISLLSFLLAFSPFAVLATEIPAGPVSGEWYASGNPYNVLGTIEVEENTSLWIHEGVEVIFTGDYNFFSYGKLWALGTETDSIHIGGGDPSGKWGGLSVCSSSDTCKIRYCDISTNNPTGGAVNIHTSDPIIEHCTLANTVHSPGSVIPGVLYCDFGSSPRMESCRLTADYCSGIIIFVADQPLIRNCEISGGAGYGIVVYVSMPTIENCVIHGFDTAALYFSDLTDATVTNCVIADNPAGSNDYVIYLESSNVTIENTIIWGNSTTGSQIFLGHWGFPSTLTISYTNLEGGLESVYVDSTCTLNWGEGMIDDDPEFVAGPLSDFHLDAGSPCIDAGNPDAQYNDVEDPSNPGFAWWPAQGTVRNDMGIYGGPGVADWILGIEETGDSNSMPMGFDLLSCYPNPFNPVTVAGFKLSVSSRINLTIYDVAGREVARLVNGWRQAGRHDVTWDAAGLPSGVYLLRMKAGDVVATSKVVLMK